MRENTAKSFGWATFLTHTVYSYIVNFVVLTIRVRDVYRLFQRLNQTILVCSTTDKISEVSGDSREGSFIFQRLSVTIQRSNAALLHESFTQQDDPDV